jgi:hypothetical protein
MICLSLECPALYSVDYIFRIAILVLATTNDLAMDGTPFDGPRRVDLRSATAVEGVESSDADTVEVEIAFQGGERCRLVMPASEVQRFAPLLLLLARGASPETEAPTVEQQTDFVLMPADSLNVGELPNGEALLAIRIGPATLGFTLPPTAAVSLGQSLMLFGTTGEPTT